MGTFQRIPNDRLTVGYRTMQQEELELMWMFFHLRSWQLLVLHVHYNKTVLRLFPHQHVSSFGSLWYEPTAIAAHC